jgi:hypothetical protein
MTHELLYIPECPVLLVGKDLLSKLWTQMCSQEDGQAALSFGSGPPRVTFSKDCLKGARDAL